jgi:CubicO group peptidase (beta-lactamase class C family)
MRGGDRVVGRRATASLRWSRLAAPLAAIACVTALAVTCAPPASAATKQARIDAVVRNAIAHHGIRAAILQITVGGRTLMTKAYGYSMTGVPATTKMHFRNGAVAISYMSTLLMELVDRHQVSLNDKVSKWLPWLRDANRVTLGELAGMSAGYHDFEVDPQLDKRLYANPFGVWTTKEQLQLMLDRPLGFKPGTNFSYAHSDYVVLGLALSKITHEPLNVALRKWVLGPLGLRNTVASQTAVIPPPVLHGFTSERRMALGIRPGTPFYEDSTYWNPSWTLANGAVETTDIADMTRTAIGVGTGKLLSRRSYLEMINPRIGFGSSTKNKNKYCDRCQKLTRYYGYGLGVVRNGAWILQDPLFGGYAAIESYLPAQKISIALAETFDQSSFSATGAYTKYWSQLYLKLGTLLAPHNPPVTHP